MWQTVICGVIPDLIWNPTFNEGMLNQVQHDIRQGMLNQVQHDIRQGMLNQVQHDAVLTQH